MRRFQQLLSEGKTLVGMIKKKRNDQKRNGIVKGAERSRVEGTQRT